ncbi:MAG TPA: hypothetical protein VK809_05380 [Bacteroidia bacterium]|jgi:hypothetical protein|nr:hypothetical protein [Bacteroidia bacterium]
MKKLSAILAGVVLFGGLSFAAPVVKHMKQDAKAPVAKQTTKPAAKPATKPAAKPAVKPAAKPATTPAAKPATHTHKGAPVKKAVK